MVLLRSTGQAVSELLGLFPAEGAEALHPWGVSAPVELSSECLKAAQEAFAEVHQKAKA